MHGMVSKWTHCFSAAVIKRHDQGNLRKSWFGLTAPEDQKSIMMKKEWQAARRLGNQARK